MVASRGGAACWQLFDKSDGDAVGYKKVEEPVQLDAGSVGE
jgi:hypothetical protein